MPKILYLIDELKGLGGAEGALLRAVRGLGEMGWQCSIASFGASENPEFLNLFPCHVHDLALRRALSLDGLRAARDLWRLVRRERFDIVHSFFEISDLFGAPVAWLAGRPVLVSSRRDMGIARNPRQDLAYRLTRPLFRQVQTVSEQVRQTFIRRDRLDPERVSVVYNGVELARIRAAQPAPDLASAFNLDPRGSTVITASGKVYPVKGIETLIRAAAIVCREFPFTNFLVAGWLLGSYPGEMLRLAESLGLGSRVRLIGSIPEIWPILKACQIYCLLSRTEGMSNALLEAMACGLPCVATAVGGNTETVVHEQTGYLVQPDDPEMAAERILELLRNPELRMELGRQGSRRVSDHFTVERMVVRMSNLYDGLLNGGKRV